MRIGVLSDTHGNLEAAKLALARMGPIAVLLHAGDYYEDAARLSRQGLLGGAAVKAVLGNCDYLVKGPAEETFTLAGRRILLTHGHRYDVKRGLERLRWRAREARADIVVFGHTHLSGFFWEEGVLFLNPGSPHLPRGGGRSCAVVEFSGRNVEPVIIDLDAKPVMDSK